MNWKQLIQDLVDRKIKLQEIADECGFASKGHVHNVKTGYQPSVGYEIGSRLVAFHKRVMRRKAPQSLPCTSAQGSPSA